MLVLVIGWIIVILFVLAAVQKEMSKYKVRLYLENKYNEEQKQKQQK